MPPSFILNNPKGREYEKGHCVCVGVSGSDFDGVRPAAGSRHGGSGGGWRCGRRRGRSCRRGGCGGWRTYGRCGGGSCGGGCSGGGGGGGQRDHPDPDDDDRNAVVVPDFTGESLGASQGSFHLGERIIGSVSSRARIVMLPLLLAALLWGCAAGTDPILQTLQVVFKRDTGADTAQLNPDFRYLRVTIGGRTALLVLGYVEKDPRGPIEVWYSAEREVLKLQHGRVVGAVGMLTEWRNVRLSDLPAWPVLARERAPVGWVRTRDVMPGYRYGVREALLLGIVPAPEKSALRELDPKQLTWFEERVEPGNAGEKALPPARYGVQLANGGDTVVYGEQCLAPEVCFTWQRWPAGKLGSE